jgi:hypothetical protein
VREQSEDLPTLIRLAEAGEVRAARTLLKQFAAGDTTPALVTYVQRCFHNIVRGDEPRRALHLRRRAGAPETAWGQKLARDIEICLAYRQEIIRSPGRGKVERAKESVAKRLGISPRAVRSAVETRAFGRRWAWIGAELSERLKREGLDLTAQDRKRLKHSKRAK